VVVRGADQPLRVSADDLLAELSDPYGRSVVLLARIWEDKITKDIPELRAHLEHVLATGPSPTMLSPTRARGGAVTTAAEWVRAGGCWWSAGGAR
jgi:hypothetical protein